MSDLATLRADLIAEHHDLDLLVAALTPTQWAQPTASPGWTVADQIGHLTYFDEAAALAISDPDGFARHLEIALAAMGRGPTALDDYTLGDFRALAPAAALQRWRAARTQLVSAAETLQPGTRVPWYGPSMGAVSFLTARLMEVWAHGTDTADAVGIRLPATDRLRHVAQLGFLTRRWSYTVRRQTAPEGTVRLSLDAPSGAVLTWGPDDADATVTGSLEEFCWVVTQRRNLLDTSLACDGIAREWLERAQAFAGMPTDPPPPGGRAW